MADLEEIVQKILLDGDAEVIHKFSEIGEAGVETFKQLKEATEAGAGSFFTMSTAIASIATAFIGAAGAIGAFVESNADAIQKTNYLAKAFGSTTEQISGLEAAFAQAGVSTKTFEQFAQRLTTTIAREWPSITESVRTSATAQDSAQERVRASILRVQEAQQKLGFVNQETSGQIQSATIREAQSYTALQFAAQKALQQIVHDTESVASANLSLEQAEQRLAALEGRPVSDEEKKALELKEAQLSVDKARQAVSDSYAAQREHQAEAAAKQAQLEEAAAEASLRREKAVAEANAQRQRAELSVREAITQREEAEERAYQASLKSIPAIRDAVKGIADGNLSAAKSIDITQVSVQNLTRGIIAAASAGKEPTGLQVLIELSRVLSSEQGKLLDSSQRLAIVQQLSQRGFNTTGVAAFELLGALSKGPAYFEQFTNAAKGAYAASEEGAHNVEHFKDELEKLTFNIDLVNRNFAASAAPFFAEALKLINESLTSSDGLLHRFVDGIRAIGVAVGALIEGINGVLHAIDKAFGVEQGETLRKLIIVLTVAVATFASAWFAIPAAIAVVVTAVGYVYENLDKIKEAAKGAWEAIKESSVVKFISGLIDQVRSLVEWLEKVGKALGGGGINPNGATPEAGNPSNSSTGFATGGFVNGPGTATSDSVPARLSTGEFVNRAASVQKYGVDFFHALNNMTLPGFAAGGLVAGPSRLSAGGSVQRTSTLNLSIDGRAFHGLSGPANVVDSLADYSIARQTSAAGKSPSWRS